MKLIDINPLPKLTRLSQRKLKIKPGILNSGISCFLVGTQRKLIINIKKKDIPLWSDYG